MINIRRLTFPQDEPLYRAAHDWMRAQPDLYRKLYGDGDFEKWCRPEGVEILDFALEADGEMIGFAMVMLRARSVCQFSLVAPPHPRLRLLLQALTLLQQAYFEQLGFAVLYAEPEHRRACKLAELMGWHRVRDGLYEYNVSHYLDDNALATETKCPTSHNSPNASQPT